MTQQGIHAADLFQEHLPPVAYARILVAEDDAMFRAILLNWLEAWGYQVTMAEDGAEAWSILQQECAPQLLLLDWMMPGLNGVEVCQLVRERGTLPYSYIVLATSKDEKQDLVRGLAAGADDYLSKPFDRDELRARLRTGHRILTLQDEQTKAREELQFQATHDGLTGLWNRRAILDLLRREFDFAARSAKTIGVMMLDADHFKKVNDTFGHPAGDVVLKEIGQRILQSVRSYDLAGRYGGEEFLVVLPDCDSDQVQTCAERIRAAIADKPVLANELPIPVTVSIGTTLLDPIRITERDALAAADASLYRAKSQGRNQVASSELQPVSPGASV